jgi:hypothetical protein
MLDKNLLAKVESILVNLLATNLKVRKKENCGFVGI